MTTTRTRPTAAAGGVEECEASRGRLDGLGLDGLGPPDVGAARRRGAPAGSIPGEPQVGETRAASRRAAPASPRRSSPGRPPAGAPRARGARRRTGRDLALVRPGPDPTRLDADVGERHRQVAIVRAHGRPPSPRRRRSGSPSTPGSPTTRRHCSMVNVSQKAVPIGKSITDSLDGDVGHRLDEPARAALPTRAVGGCPRRRPIDDLDHRHVLAPEHPLERGAAP